MKRNKGKLGQQGNPHFLSEAAQFKYQGPKASGFVEVDAVYMDNERFDDTFAFTFKVLYSQNMLKRFKCEAICTVETLDHTAFIQHRAF